MPAVSDELSLVLHGGNALVAADGSPVRLSTKKTLLCLVVLADRQGEKVSRRALAQAVWPQSTEQSARASLRTALSDVRRVLSKDGLYSDDDSIELRAGFVNCCTIPADGEFMPDFDDDWVIERRIQDRDRAVTDLVQEARAALSSGNASLALEFAERAAKLDPWSSDAVALRVEILESQGNTSNAAEVSRIFRRRMLRDFGALVPIGSDAPAVKSPLVQTCEWLIDRDPLEATAFLAATAQHWEVAPAREALELHLRVLERAGPSTPYSLQVQAHALYLQWCLNGIGNDIQPVEQALDSAISERDAPGAHRLANILAYGLLSAGQFGKALRVGNDLVSIAKAGGRLEVVSQAEMTLSILHYHAGDEALSQAMMRRLGEGAESAPSLLEAAHRYLHLAHSKLVDGDLTGSHEALLKSRQAFRSNSGDRLLAYTYLTEAELMEAAGDTLRARELLCHVREMGAEVIGHSAMAMAGDMLAEIDCRLGEFDLSAESLTNAQAFRNALGTVSSLRERRRMAPVKRTLMEKLGDAKLRQMSRKITSSRLPD